MRLLIFIFLFSTCACLKAITINGQILPDIKGGKMPKKVYLKSFTLSTSLSLDSANVSPFGSYVFEKQISQVGLYYLFIGSARYKVLLTPFESEVRVSNELNNKEKYTIDGSKENEAYKKFRDAVQFYEEDIFMLLNMSLSEDSINVEVKKQIKNLGSNIYSIRYYYPNTYTATVLCGLKSYTSSREIEVNNNMRSFLKLHFLDSVKLDNRQFLEEPTFDDVFMGYVANLLDTGTVALENFIKTLDKNAAIDSTIYKYTQRQLFQYLMLTKQGRTLRFFIDNALQDDRNKTNLALIEQMNTVRAVLSGEQFKEIVGKNRKGEKLSLSQVVSQNKLTMLVFWDPSCSHCKESLPLVSTLFSQYSKKGLGIYGVSSDDESDWQKFLDNTQLPWFNVFEEKLDQKKSAASVYFVIYTPTFVLIKQDGKILRRFIGIKDLENEIKKQL